MKRLVIFSIIALSFAFAFRLVSKKDKGSSVPVLMLETVQELKLGAPLEPGRGSFVSAASGIIKSGDQLYVVSDDEQYLFSMNLSDKTLKEHRLLSTALVADPKQRKSEKADFESLVELSKKEWPPNGAIVAWPSGSGEKRMKAVVMPFDEKGQFGEPLVSDILPLVYRMQKEIQDLNIEGLLVRDKKVFLFQRGNASKGKNAIIEMPLEGWITGLKTSQWAGKINYQKIKIGKLSGVNLTFSDVTWTQYGLLALASAEDTASSYADGAVYGSVLVRVVGEDAQVLAKFEPLVKLEGLTAAESNDGLELYMVDDADSPVAASRLYRVKLSSEFLSEVR
jgi:hypothetical protein